MKDWTGNKNSVFTTLAASNHTTSQREADDYYATDPRAIDLLLDVENFHPDIWECAAGENHMADRLKRHGFNVRTSDIVPRTPGTEVLDFLSPDISAWHGDIITNPPYKHALRFITQALSIIPDGRKVAMFLKLQFMEGKARKHLFTTCPPKTIYVSSSRIMCAKNGDFQGMQAGGGSAVAYAWYVWQRGYVGNTMVRWIN